LQLQHQRMVVDDRGADNCALRAESAFQGLYPVAEFLIAVLGGRELGLQAFDGYVVRRQSFLRWLPLTGRGVDLVSEVPVALQEVSVNAGACNDSLLVMGVRRADSSWIEGRGAARRWVWRETVVALDLVVLARC
jgi:hypothetical protein